jgi:hypothetical protein
MHAIDEGEILRIADPAFDHEPDAKGVSDRRRGQHFRDRQAEAALPYDNNAPAQLVLNPGLPSTVLSGARDDVLWGGGDGSSMFGRNGQDTMRDQNAQATMHAGLGDDQVVIGNRASVIIENMGEGTASVWVPADCYAVGDNLGISRLGGRATTVSGAFTDDQLVGNSLFASRRYGRDGNDVLRGGQYLLRQQPRCGGWQCPGES